MRYLTLAIQIPLLGLLTPLLSLRAADGQQNLQLVAARDHIEGSFTTSQSVYADKNFIYLASAQGRLFILARNRSANFPLVETIQVSFAPLTAVRGDSDCIYVNSADGSLRMYQNRKPFFLLSTVSLSDLGLKSLTLISTPGKGNARLSSERLYVSRGQAELAAFGDRLYLSALNEGETGLEVVPQTLALGQSYGQTFAENTTTMFDRWTGQRIAGVPNPTDLFGRLSQVSIYVDEEIAVQTTPGCCGPGIVIRDPVSLAVRQFIPRGSTNTVQRRGQWLIAGNEGGDVDVFDLSQNPSPQVATAGLRQITANTGYEDIEIRALWTDTSDNLIFAASSWGNEQSRSPFLPSFFVLELVAPKKQLN